MYSTEVHAIKRLCRHFDRFYDSTYLLLMLIDNRFKAAVKGLIRLSGEVFEISTYLFRFVNVLREICMIKLHFS